MARFEDFTPDEKRVIQEAMTWSQSEFYDPGHTQEERDTLHDLIREIEGRPAQGIPTAPEPIEEGRGEAQEPAKNVQQAAPERREALHPTPPENAPSAPTEAAAGVRPCRMTPKGETGFLLIKCDQCGDEHAFNARQPITTYRCGKCGHHTPLTDMHRLRVICECGRKSNYRTNIVTQQMDVNCFKCGCPVAVEWSARHGQYEPIGWAESRKGGGRRK